MTLLQVHVYDPYDDDYYQTVPLDSHQAAYISSGHYGPQYGGGWPGVPRGGARGRVPLLTPRFPGSSRGDPRHRARGSLPRLRGPDGAGAAGRGRHRRRPGLLHVDALLVLVPTTLGHGLPSLPSPALEPALSALSLPRGTDCHTRPAPGPSFCIKHPSRASEPPKPAPEPHSTQFPPAKVLWVVGRASPSQISTGSWLQKFRVWEKGGKFNFFNLIWGEVAGSFLAG